MVSGIRPAAGLEELAQTTLRGLHVTCMPA
jgi:hypothetical protein